MEESKLRLQITILTDFTEASHLERPLEPQSALGSQRGWSAP